jgi:hypothetical protein
MSSNFLRELNANQKSGFTTAISTLLIILAIPAFVGLTVLTQFTRNNFKGLKLGTGVLINSKGEVLVGSDGKPQTFDSTIVNGTDDTFRCAKVLDNTEIKTLVGLTAYLIIYQFFILMYSVGVLAGKDSSTATKSINILMMILAVFNIIVLLVLVVKLQYVTQLQDTYGNFYKCVQFKSATGLSAFTGSLYAGIVFISLQLLYVIIHMNTGSFMFNRSAQTEKYLSDYFLKKPKSI